MKLFLLIMLITIMSFWIGRLSKKSFQLPDPLGEIYLYNKETGDLMLTWVMWHEYFDYDFPLANYKIVFKPNKELKATP